MRTGTFEYGVGATLIVAVTMFAAVTVASLALGDQRVELGIGPLVLYRFVSEPGLSEVHVGPLVFLLALVAGAGRFAMARRR